MTAKAHLVLLRRDQRGASMIEFGLLAPVMIAMLLGVLALGIQMQNYNAMRGIGYDLNRYTVIQYQKETKITASVIEDMAKSIASRSPYGLNGDQFDVDVTEGATGVVGAKKFTVTMSYTPQSLLSFINVKPPTIHQTETIIVPA